MAIWDDVRSSLASGTGTSVWTILFIVIGLGVGFLLLGVAAWYWYVKKRWNIKAEIKLTRSGGALTNAEWGKAFYDVEKGVVLVKRPGFGKKAIPVKVFDIREYIQGDNTISFVQVAGDDLRPIRNSSWEEFEEPVFDDDGKPVKDKKGNILYEKSAMMNIRVDTGLNKAWSAAWRAAAKQAYSLKTFFTQFQTPIAIAIVIVAVFVGFAIVWTRLGSICG